MALKKDIIIPILDKEVVVKVDFNILDKVERVYQCTAEVAAAVHLVDTMRIQRRHLAQVISLWVQDKSDMKPSEVLEAVMTAPQKQIARYAGMIQAAVLYSIRGDDGRPLITDEQFDALVHGRDIEPPKTDEAPPKATAAKKSRAPRKAT